MKTVKKQAPSILSDTDSAIRISLKEQQQLNKKLEKQIFKLRNDLILKKEKDFLIQSKAKIKHAAELKTANIELIFQNGEKEKRAAELGIANIELVFQNGEKEKRAAELGIANIELVFQNEEKEKRAAELVIANIELVFQNGEKEKRAAELGIANIELKFQNSEKEKRAIELNIANIELVYQNGEKEDRASELGLANIELLFQNGEKEKRAAELGIANIELVFQNGEKEKRAAELGIANIELKFQNREKEKRAAELVIANVELVYQNGEKEKRAAELGVANIELVFQNGEKEKRAAELVIANIELIFQNGEKEKRATELSVANKELEAFTYISSHDLQEPLRKIQTFANMILKSEYANLSEQGKNIFDRMHDAAKRMQILIKDLLQYSHTNVEDRKFEITGLDEIVKDVCEELTDSIRDKKAIINANNLGNAYINKFQFRQVIINLISNALKFSKKDVPSEITIKYKSGLGLQLEQENSGIGSGKLNPDKNYYHLNLTDNGIGYDLKYKDQIFDVFQRLHGREEYAGTGIGLAIVKKIIDNHQGAITSNSEIGKGASFDIYIPESEAAA